MRSAARLRSLSALIAAITFGAGTADAQTTYTWSKLAVPASFMWGDADNWTASGVPSALDTAVFSSNTAGVFGTVDLGGVARPISVINFTSTSVYSLSNGTLTGVTQINQTGNVGAGTTIPAAVTITTAGGGTGILSSNVTTGGALQLQGMVTAGGVTKTGANTLRLGTSGTSYNGAIAGDIVINGGTFQAQAGNVSATDNPIASSGAAGTAGVINTGDDIIIGASGVTLSLQHSNLAAAGAAVTYDWGRNVIAGNNSFTFNADRAGGLANSGVAQIGTVSIGTATLSTNSGNGFTQRSDAVNLDSGATTTLNIGSSMRVDSLAGDATTTLRKTGGQTLSISEHAGTFAGKLELGGGTFQVEANVASALYPLASMTTPITFIAGTNLNLRAEDTFDFVHNITFAPAAITSTINVDRTGTTATGKRLTVGTIDLSQGTGLPKTLSTSGANTYTLGTDEIIVNSGTGTLSTGIDTFPAKLTVGSGATFNKLGTSTLTLNDNQSTTILGAVNVLNGTVTATVAGSLGNQGVSVGNLAPNTAGFFTNFPRVNYNAVEAGSGAGIDVTAVAGGFIDLNVTPTANDAFSIQAHGRILGNTAQLAGLTLGTNLTLAADAIISHDNPSSAGNTVGGLGSVTTPLYYYGLQANATSLPTIGAGTPWKGISGESGAARTIQGTTTLLPALININGGDNNPLTIEAFLQAMDGTNNRNLNIGSATANDSSVNFVSTAVGGEKVTLGIRGQLGTTVVGNSKGGTVAFNDPGTQTNIFNAVDKIIVEGSMLTLTTAGTLGSIGTTPGVPVDVINDGVLDIGNAATNLIDGNVVIKNGGTLVLNDNQPLNGVGSITIDQGGKIDISGAPVNILAGGGGTQVVSFAGTGHTIRFSANDIAGMDAAVPNSGATYVITGGATAANGPGTNLSVTTNTQTAGISLDNGVLTNDGTSRGFIGPITLNNTNLTIAATRNTNFVVQSDIATTGNVKIGSLTAIDGRDKSSNAAALTSLGLQDPYNSLSQVALTGTLAAGNVDVFNTHLALLNATTAITGNLNISGGVLYLDGGGPVTGAIGELSTALQNGTLAGKISIGVNTRIEMKLNLTSASTRTDINQAFEIGGEVTPADNRSMWVSRNSGSDTGVNFNNVTLKNGATLAIDEDSTDIRMNLKLAGNAVASTFDPIDYLSVTRDASLPAFTGSNPAILTQGRLNILNWATSASAVSNVFGTIGEGVQIDIQRGQINLLSGSTLNGVITTQNAPVGGGSFVLSTSNGATADSTIGGTGRIEIGRSAVGIVELEVRGTEIASGTAPLHTQGGTVRVVNDGINNNIDAVIRSNRHNDSTVTARVAVPNVELASGSTAQFASTNAIPMTIATTTLLGNATIDVANTGRTFTTIDAGTNDLTIQGAAAPTITNPITAKNLTINGLTMAVPLANVTGNLTVGANPGGTVSSGTTGTSSNVTIADNIAGSLTINSSAASINSGAGTKTIGGPIAINYGALNVSNGTVDAGTNMVTGSGTGPLVAGLRENRSPGAFDLATANSSAVIRLGTTQAQITTGWGTDETFTYTGEFFVPNNNGDGTGSFAFAENFDDSVRLVLDGVTLLNNGLWNDATGSGVITKPTGWYAFEARFGQGAGGAGPSVNDGWNASFAFGLDLTLPVESSTTTPIQANFVAPVDNGSMNMFRTNLGSNLNVAVNSTFKAGGMTNVSEVNLSGNNSLVQLVANSLPTNSTANKVSVASGAAGALQVDEAGDLLTVAQLNLSGSLALSGAGGLTVTGTGTGTGTLTSSLAKLTNNGNITGPTSVSAGTVGGIGTFAALDLTGTSKLSPGNSPGTLTTGNLTLGDTTFSSFELNPTNTVAGGGINDLVIVNGDLNLDGTLQVSATGPGFLNGTYVLFDYSGALTGDLTIDPAFMASVGSANIVYDTANTQVLLSVVAIPEPSTFVLGALGLLGVAGFRLRRRRLA